MGDDKKTGDDIIPDAPADLSDDMLEEVDGGLLRGMHIDPVIPGNLVGETIYAGSVADTIYAGGVADTIYAGMDLDLSGGLTKFKR